MEVSALKHVGAIGVHGRSPLLRLQSDERLIALVRRGNHHAYEALVARYQPRLHAFCRHMLGSREDAEDVLQEVFAAAFNAIQADDRAINARPWLYRIARNRSLNHLRKVQAIGVDSMDVHLSEDGQSTAEKVHKREEFRLLLADVGDLPESQRSALLLREIEALSYEQISEAMETTVPSVKSLLVRARVALAEAAEARQLTCEDVRFELGAVAEGLQRTSAPARRHVRGCDRCSVFRSQLKQTNRALAVVLPVGPLVLLRKLLFLHGSSHAAHGAAHAAHAGGVSTGSAAAGSTAAGSSAVAGSSAFAGSAAGGGLVGIGTTAVATKAVAGLAVAALATGGAIAVDHAAFQGRSHHAMTGLAAATPTVGSHHLALAQPAGAQSALPLHHARVAAHHRRMVKHTAVAAAVPKPVTTTTTTTSSTTTSANVGKTTTPPIEQGSSTTVLPAAGKGTGITGAVGSGTATPAPTSASTTTTTTTDATTTTAAGSPGSSGGAQAPPAP
ncbi:MAG: RNA polymerase sigma factor [Solirubrobacteraceae bacterium]|nr:MAG: hypothetical protein DLM63_11290 [Solirubrobacterales bacterium]